MMHSTILVFSIFLFTLTRASYKNTINQAMQLTKATPAVCYYCRDDQAYKSYVNGNKLANVPDIYHSHCSPNPCDEYQGVRSPFNIGRNNVKPAIYHKPCHDNHGIIPLNYEVPCYENHGLVSITEQLIEN